MDIQAIKVDLIHWLTEVEDLAVLKKLQDFKRGQETGLSDAHKALLDERMESYESDPENVLDWEDVMKELEKDLLKFKLKLLQEAHLDIKEIIEWYDGAKLGLGRRFYGALKSKLDYISRQPLNFQAGYRDSRSALLDKFPYQIHFRVMESERSVIVFAITHTSRNPRIWKNKT